jgi:DNA (cytosine-5)-methyltransferase 1
MRDARNDLVFQFVRFVRMLRPKAVMMENVPGLAKNRRIKDVVSSLKALGYECEYKVLDAANYGVPQRRKRMILLGSRFGKVPFAKPARVGSTVRKALLSISKRSLRRDTLHNLPERRAPKILKLIKQIPKNGGSRIDLPRSMQLACHRRCSGFKDVYGRMSWDKVAPTITGGCCNPSKGRFLHPSRNRCITLREAALLQSFPPSYFFSTKRGKFPAAQMIGNALPPEFIRRHAARVLSWLPSQDVSYKRTKRARAKHR